ncbi:GNAT family N-acetyltransferase [Streptomyces iconiensis]|uniref:GNAT family N-acetyltransferase n=1 Tax=Streptomyces iconiensis TaxID=1384038 RepID=A0ABT6ZUN8_9ACTN|nr:GNAT family N-acetyltransferase [Streptomyces iconiensis]MDJ1132771.1 GNAT family N-acetyltransferase [Streptomyces iconiensis]
MSEQDVEVTDNPGENRYEARVGGALAGATQYKRAPHVVALLHTEVEPEFEGRGVGGALARTALDTARAAGDEVVPVCPFVAGYIHQHPEYQPLVYEKKGGAKDR